MLAVFAKKPYQIVIDEVVCAPLKEDAVRVRVAYGGICGSDLHAYRGQHAFRVPPVMLGHEAAGVVEAVGSAVSGVAVGDRVTVMPQVGCGECAYCRAGATNLCQGKTVPGTPAWGGLFAQYFDAPASVVVPLGDISCRHGALLEPLAVAHHVLARAQGARVNDDLVIWGAGTIGQMLLMLAPLFGYRRVLVTDIVDYNLRVARELGAVRAVNVLREDAEAAARDCFGPDGAGTVALAAGGPDIFDTAIGIAAPGGAILYFTMITQPATMRTHPIVAKELRLFGSVNYTMRDFEQAARLLAAGKIPLERIITHVFPMERAAEAFTMLERREENAIKILLSFE